jgi:predicted AAA+ superfamily ATPase
MYSAYNTPVIARSTDKRILRGLLREFPVTAILGPRQCGKTTLAREFAADHYFDLENPRDAALFETPQVTLESLSGLIVIDEVQRAKDLFPLIRHLVDTHRDQRYLILGNASGELLHQSSETLAGRIAFHELGGFRLCDVGSARWRRLWLRGGLPPAFTARSDAASSRWREQYVATFLERDIPQLGVRIPAAALRRFWTMLCHYHGQVLNSSELARSFGVSDMSVRRYLEVLESAFVLRLLQPWHANLGKRLVKHPKLYLRDTGLLHSLLAVHTARDLAANNKLGASWEGFALEVTARAVRKRGEELFFWATHSGTEVDLFWRERGRNWAVEFKYADAPRLTPSMVSATSDLELNRLWVVYPGVQTYNLTRNVTVLPLAALMDPWQYV